MPLARRVVAELQKAKDVFVAGGGNPDSLGYITHKLLRSVFYRCDLTTLFQSFPVIEKAIAKENA